MTVRAGTYKAELLLPGDVTEHGIVKDCLGDGDEVTVSFARAGDGGHRSFKQFSRDELITVGS